MNNQKVLEKLEGTEVAIIGMNGRFPGAHNLNMLWQNVQQGIDSITDLDDEILQAAGVAKDTIQDPDYVKASAVLDGFDQFDADFFGLAAKDAAIMDPQHRLLLQSAWASLEDAGYDAEQVQKPIAVFAGCGFNSYMLFNLVRNEELLQSEGLFLLRHLGNDKDFLATRISYLLNLRGPSINVQTACSTALVAIHLACQSLLNGESYMALAGGVTIKVPHVRGYWHREGKQHLSGNGHCRPFDVDADGMVSGSGVGVVTLKLLEDAILDGDHVYAVIKGSATNNDGSLKAGYMTPSVRGQAQVVVEALEMADVDPASIGFVSAHGTGTPLGDTIEVAALKQAFNVKTDEQDFCALGSVKGNIGHADTAAGIASLATAVYALHDKMIPPNANFKAPNPTMELEGSPFYINDTLREWEAGIYPRRASVNAIGIGGTNAHIVLEEAPRLMPSSPSRPWQLLMLSAKNKSSLTEMEKNLGAHLTQNNVLNWADVAYTLQVGRRHFRHRSYAICQEGKVFKQYANEVVSERGVTFLFSDAGLKTADMAVFYEREVDFREQVDNCIELIRPYTPTSTTIDIWNLPEEEPLVQFIWQYSLATLLQSWGVPCHAAWGVGVGQLVGACLADVIDLQSAFTIILEQNTKPADHLWAANGTNTLQAHHVNHITLTPPKQDIALRLSTIRLYNPTTGVTLTEDHILDEQYWREAIWTNGRLRNDTNLMIPKTEDILLDFGSSVQAEDRFSIYTPIEAIPNDNYGALLNTVGKLWLAGVPIDWPSFYKREQRYRVSLPTYAFQRQRHWIDAPLTKETARQIPFWRKWFKRDKQTVVSNNIQTIDREISAATNPIEEQIQTIWQDILNIKPIGIHERFFELGGTSQQAVRLITQINLHFNESLPVTTLFEAPTIHNLSQMISDGKERTVWQHLVPIKPDGSRTPFFCVHGVGGFVLELHPLAQALGEDQPFYGIQAHGVDGKPLEELSLEEIATAYLQEIKTVQPQGPYLIGGYCFGGKVAYEMAQQLQAQGDDVALLVMIHSEATQYKCFKPQLPKWQQSYYSVQKRVMLEKDNLANRSAKWPYLRQRVHHVWNLFQVMRLRGQENSTPIQADNRYWTDYLVAQIGIRNTIASQKYQARPYNGRTLFIRGSVEMQGIDHRLLLGWDDVLSGNVEIREVPAHQENIIEYPNVTVWADNLNDALTKACKIGIGILTE